MYADFTLLEIQRTQSTTTGGERRRDQLASESGELKGNYFENKKSKKKVNAIKF